MFNAGTYKLCYFLEKVRRNINIRYSMQISTTEYNNIIHEYIK